MDLSNAYAIYVKIKESGNTLFVCLYVDELMFIRNYPNMFRDFKQTMIKEFEITNIVLIILYLGIKIK